MTPGESTTTELYSRKTPWLPRVLSKQSGRRRSSIYLLAIIVSLALLEVVSYVGLLLLAELRPERFAHGFVDSHFDKITEQYRQNYVEYSHDVLLGWTNRPLQSNVWTNSVGEDYTVSYAADGSRADSYPDMVLLAHTYGDSFTWCDEVSDDQTWQFFMKRQLQRDVKNFGVGAYGTAQALQRFKQQVQHGNVAPITILGIMEENVNRVVNSFRPFYNSQSGVLLGFKPSIRIKEDKEVRFIANPYNDREMSLDGLRKLAHDIVDDEYWIAANNRLRVRFPYSFYLALSVQRIVWDKVTRWTEPDSSDGAYPNLWATDEGKAVMHWLIDDFIQSAADASTRPLLLFFPKGETLGNNDSPNYLDFISEVRVRYPGLDIVDLYSYEFDASRLFVRPYDGHLSVYGNQFVAGTVVNYLHQSARSATNRELAERAQ